MKIAVNTRLLLKNKLEGIGWFTYETLKRITQNHPEHEFLFIFDRPYHKDFIFSDNITPVVAGPPARHPILFYIWFEHVIPKILKKYNADCFVSPDGFISLKSNIPVLQVIHDINFEHFPEFLPPFARWYYKKYFNRFAQRADRIATVSEYSKKDIIEQYKIDPGIIDVTFNGASDDYKPVSEEVKKKIREKYTDGTPFFLFVGALHPRKNIVNLLKAFDNFKKNKSNDIKLLIVGDKFWGTNEMKAQYEQMTFKKDVIFTGRLLFNELLLIYPSALALCYVSIFEGFGIPIVEAMYCDTPVITSSTSSMPEVAGDAALYADPFLVDSITKAMNNIAYNSEIRKKLIENGRKQRQKFSWDITANKLWDSICKLNK
ncbi:MAG: glycosyltransferase family 1 protein [Marinilabiliales bacterium]